MSIAEPLPGADAAIPAALISDRPTTVATEAPAFDAATAGKPPSFSARTFAALGNTNFRLVFLGNLFQFASMQMMGLVQGVLVFQLTGSFAALGIVSLANAIPGLLFYPVGGVVADRFPKKVVLQTGQLFSAVAAAVLALLAASGLLRFEHLIFAAILQGGVQATTTPSRHTIIPDVVGRDKMMNAIALNTSGTNLMQLVGPGIGGVLLAFSSPTIAFATMSGLSLLAVTFTARLPKRPIFSFAATSARDGVAVRRPGGSVRDLFDGARHIANNPAIRTLISVNFVIVLCTTPYTMMLPGFVKEVLHRGAAEQGALVAISGIGAMAGSLVIASLPDRNRGKVLVLVAFLLGASIVAFATSTNYFLTMPIMLGIGAASAMRLSLGQVLIQTYSAEEYRGRVVSVWMMQYSLVSFGTFFVGVLAEWFGPQLAIGGLAGGLLVFMLLVTRFMPRFRALQ